MKKNSILLVLVLVLNVLYLSANPKREMRATWLTTVANIDWPMPTTSDVEQQKNELLEILDACAETNMNTVLFHIRPACDALYKSKYEPWSSYLNHGRGVDPGYDPLQFCIEECHKRGLTCHGWINPYRYGKRGAYDWTGDDDTTQLNYKHTHPEWLLYYANDIYLDPAQPQVRQQIKNVVGDIINSYDIDGILMDDYFYPYGGTTTQDKESVEKYKPADMSVGDWRRQNVNKMIKDVYDTIQAVKPWVTFGVSPFGIWTTNSTVAKERGIKLPSVSGGNMYEEIYCDPVAWLEEGTVDYISPQLYWKIGGGQDYRKLSKWWAEICNRFGKHFYSSMALDRYKRGDEGFAFRDIRQQLGYNRIVTDDAPGAVFFNTRAWSEDKGFKDKITRPIAEFANIALPPAINWKPAEERAMVENLSLKGQTLSWSHPEDKDLRYVIYAVPNDSLYINNVYSRSDMLLAVTYETQYELPSTISSSKYQIAVSVLDRYNNEYSLRILNQELRTPQAVTTMYPNQAAEKALPFTFFWEAVEEADSYIIQVAYDAEMTQIIFTQETTDTFFETANRVNLEYLPLGVYYWRVKARIPNAGDTWSKVEKFSLSLTDALENITTDKLTISKFFQNGYLYIQRGECTYNLLGNIIRNNKQ